MSLPNLLPDLSADEYEALKASIAEGGYWPTHPIVVDELGNVLDGHNRKRAAAELGIEAPVVVLAGLSAWDKVSFAVRSNTARRHLTPDQRRALLKRLMEVHEEVLRAAGEEARRTASARGGAAKPSATDTNKRKLDRQRRDAAAEATRTPFNGPVTVRPPEPERVDTLKTYADLLGTSRRTVARDRAQLDRMDRIEAEAREAGRPDVEAALAAPRPDLDALEREVGLRSVSPAPPPSELTGDRETAFNLIGEGLKIIHGTQITPRDGAYVARVAGAKGKLLAVDLLNLIRAIKGQNNGEAE